MGVILFALPKLLIGEYKAFGVGNTAFPLCLIRNSTTSVASKVCEEGSGPLLNIAIFFLAQFIIGAGATPLQTLGKFFFFNFMLFSLYMFLTY